MRTLSFAAGAVASIALAVVAAQAQNGDLGSPGTTDTSKVTAGTYIADPVHTLVGWRVNHFGFSDYFGIFGNVSGTLKLDPANLAASEVEITVPVSEVTTASALLTSHLLAPGKDGAAADFFGPQPADATFKSTSVRPTNDNQATIVGNLTLNGVTKPVEIKAKLTGVGVHPRNNKETVGFTGTARLKRSEFNINYGLPLVTDTVDLDITVAFEKG